VRETGLDEYVQLHEMDSIKQKIRGKSRPVWGTRAVWGSEPQPRPTTLSWQSGAAAAQQRHAAMRACLSLW